jgi:radical SAM superfamily enzyme
MNKNMVGVIFGDSFFYHGFPRVAISRSTGSHRIATLMRKRNVDVEVVDFFNSWTDDELNAFISKFPKLDFIGLGLGLSMLETNKVNLLISKVKEKHPSTKIIAGGSNVLDNQYDGVDMFFKGFTEGAIDDIIEYLKTGRFNPFLVETIKTHGMKKVVNCTHHYEKFDLSLLNTEYLDSDFIQPNEALPIEFSRGCIFKCKFCNFPLVGKNKNDYIREKEDVKAELIRNYERWGTTRYILTDDTFNDNEIKIDMVYEIANELDFKLSLASFARVDLLRAYKGSLDKLIKAGFKGFFFGIESLNERTSRSINKGLTGDKLKNYLIEIKKEYPQLHITGSFIVGLPYEPIETFYSNVDWAIEANVFDTFVFFPFSITVDNKITAMSPFSYEWQNYGYEIMSDEEIDKKIQSMPSNIKDLMIKYHNANYDSNFKNNYLPWKNEHMDFLDAVVYTDECMKKTYKHSTHASFATIARSFNTDNFDDALHLKKSSIDDNKQIKDTTDFVNSYKLRKLSI